MSGQIQLVLVGVYFGFGLCLGVGFCITVTDTIGKVSKRLLAFLQPRREG